MGSCAATSITGERSPWPRCALGILGALVLAACSDAPDAPASPEATAQARAKANLGALGRLADAIEESGGVELATIEEDTQRFRAQLITSRYFERWLATAVTAETLREHYRAHAEGFAERHAHVRQIVITPASGRDANEAATRTRAQGVHSRLRRGDDFVEVAQAASDDDLSREAGGDRGWVDLAHLPQVLRAAVEALEPGGFTEPLLVGESYVIVSLVAGPRTVQLPFERVRAKIEHQLRQAAKRAETSRLLGEATDLAATSSAPAEEAPREN